MKKKNNPLSSRASVSQSFITVDEDKKQSRSTPKKKMKHSDTNHNTAITETTVNIS
jgi:hypothetical protein